MGTHVGTHMLMNVCVHVLSRRRQLLFLRRHSPFLFKQAVFLDLVLTGGRLTDEVDWLCIYLGLSSTCITSVCHHTGL